MMLSVARALDGARPCASVVSLGDVADAALRADVAAVRRGVDDAVPLVAEELG
jgi:hypothetical protein